MLTLFTSTVDYVGDDRLDASRGGIEYALKKRLDPGPGAVLAPSRELIDDFYSRVGDRDSAVARSRLWPEFELRYTAEMRRSYKQHPAAWDFLLSQSSLTLCCYCRRTPGFCHRRLAAEILAKASRGGAIYCGERWIDWQLGALTVYPEWAYALATLGKDCENRPKAFAVLVGRWVAIHGGKSIDGSARRPPSPQSLEALDCVIDTADAAYEELGKMPPAAFLELSEMSHAQQCELILSRGRGIVALAHVSDCSSQKKSPWFVGPQAYYFDAVMPLSRPIQCRGAQGLWEVPTEALQLLRSDPQLAAHPGLAAYLGASP